MDPSAIKDDDKMSYSLIYILASKDSDFEVQLELTPLEGKKHIQLLPPRSFH